MARGLFITVEGGEGVGKSTNIDCLERVLRDNGLDIVVTREPGGTRLGEDVRENLLRVRGESVSPLAELLLIFAARAQHISEVIEPALAAGRWVLCDRFTDATYAYQGGGRGVDTGTISRLEALVQGSLRPDFTVLLDAPVAVGMERARDRGELDRFEREELAFFERVRACYLELAQQHGERYRVVAADAELEVVQSAVRACGEEFIACWRDRGDNP